MLPYNSETITSFDEFAKLLKKYDGESILFRGQAEHDWELIPKLGRKSLKLTASDVRVAEKDIFKKFDLESRPYLPASVETDWDRLVLAQHHGLPTRLLDWSKNPLAALWFAVENPAKEDKPGVVWVFEFKDDLIRVYPVATDARVSMNRSTTRKGIDLVMSTATNHTNPTG
jgi:hypothetical protein